ncbi:transcription-repair coupling factor [bacterium]|nr:transcription-repair coupling factor [bacterium]
MSVFSSTLFETIKKPLLVLFNDPVESEAFRDDLESFLSHDSIAYFPDQVSSETDGSSPKHINLHLVDSALQTLSSTKRCVAISTYEVLDQRLPFPALIKKKSVLLETGLRFTRENLVARLQHFEYQREYSVEFPMEYAVRGDIVDFFPSGHQRPIRIEFFEDTISSIRIFDVETQLTIEKLKTFSIRPPSTISDDQISGLLSHLPEDALVLLPHSDIHRDCIKNLLEKHDQISSRTIIHLNDLWSSDIHYSVVYPVLEIHGLTAFEKHVGALRLNSSKNHIFLFCINNSQQSRLSTLLQSETISIISAPLSNSFEIPDINLFVYTDIDIFDKKRKTKTFNFLPEDVQHSTFNPDEINVNDLLVHLNYGIGKYVGLKKVSAFGSTRECLVIAYDGGSKVFVPLEKMTVVHKYRSAGGFVPMLSKLGSGEWDRIKLRTKRSIEDVSQEIIELYSKRLKSTGFAYSKDNDFQLSMEAEFSFEETPDQLKAILDIKKDMESDLPLDRLLCGDVGFGKTEVAIRAAFKAVNDSKQVVILAPTTILADQHFVSFTKRLNKYPISIALLSRFVKKADQQRVLKDLADNKIDIVIGTHRLLSKDIRFSDLGLLIIDEEHRFGVKDKDRIKKFRANIDVLSLSATPIPRSLHFSLIGARDFSLINTPPKERLPIFTETISFDKNIIVSAIYHEISRGGQVFFVHNEIKTIASITASLEKMFPDLIIRHIHGQMSEKLLEPIMLDFINNNIHVLVTTAIIESGIDIPNANTIFINNAQNFGLSQLYQLRGRVGRHNRRAYAYLIVSNPSRLSHQAIKRLQTIQRHTSLGSGYSISLEDLEIRGAGNVFGLEQSGNIHAVGYDLYIKIMNGALSELKDKTAVSEKQNFPALEEVTVTFPYPSYFPESYISSESLRLNYYKKLCSTTTITDIQQIQSEVMDIFGKLPSEGENLFDLSIIKMYCSLTGIYKIVFYKNRCNCYFQNNHPFKESRTLLTILKEISDALDIYHKFIPSKDLLFVLFYQKNRGISKIKQFLYLLGGKLNL